MKKVLLFVLTIHCSLFTIHSNSQPCLPEGIAFAFQEQIDNFQINYPGCTEIEGDVYITGDDISNLNGLNVLCAIGGSLEITWNESLQNLTGLENLTNINGDLSLSWIQLNKLTGLEGLTYIGGNFGLNAIGNLQDLTGLENLTSIGGNLQFGSYGTGSSGGTSLTSLSGLEGLDSIGGGVWMLANGQLTSISALDGLTYLGGHLSIVYNHSLATCQSNWLCDYLLAPNGAVTIQNNAPGCNSIIEVGSNCGDSIPCLPFGNYNFISQEDIDNFQNVFPGCTELEGDLYISGSWMGKSSYSKLDSEILNLNGLNVITSIEGYLSIYMNELLTTLAGLDEVTSIGGGLWISDNDSLSNLSGLGGLESIGGDLYINSNDTLASLTGLEGLTSIGGELRIDNNDALTSLMGLDNIWSGTIEELYISHNSLLSTCEVKSVCDFLAIPYGIISIFNNAPGCNNPEEVLDACDYSICLPEGITFTTQVQIDNFQVNYPGCKMISGFVNIYGNDITNLEGLNGITFIGGNMEIKYHDILSNLTGLDSLETIMGGLWIDHNDALTSLTGLEGLTSIGDQLWIHDSNALTSLIGLEGLTSIGDFLRISDNNALTSLNGLENINAASISNLTIKENDLLFTCEIQSICDYLASPNGTVSIQFNAPGCNSPEEVQEACDSITLVPELTSDNSFAIIPNPVESTTIIKYNLSHDSPVFLKILDLSGREIKTLVNELQSHGEQSVEYNTIGLKPGIYFAVLKTNPACAGQTRKIIKL